MSDRVPAARRSRSTVLQSAGRRWLWVVPLLLLPLPFVLNPYLLYVACLMMVYALVGVGFNVLIGNLGQLAFANAAFFGLGAYATGILMHHLGWPYLLAGLCGGLVSGLLGLCLSLPALRGIRGAYLGILTLAVGELLRWGYIHTPGLTLGSTGLAVPLPHVFGFPMRSDVPKFYLFLLVTTVLIVGTANLLRSKTGRAFMAIRDNETAAAGMGIGVAHHIIYAFAWSGFVVGVGGAFYAGLVRLVTPDAFDLAQLLLHFAIVTIGGVGNIAGSIFGAIVLTAAPEIMRGWPGLEVIFTAGLMVLVLLFRPKGLVSLLYPKVPALRATFHRA